MFNYKCDNGIYIKQGRYEAIKCKVNNGYCKYVRFCPTKNGIEHSTNAKDCEYKENKIK